MRLDLVKQAERAELAALRKAARRERRAERWARWVAWWSARARELKVAATVVGSAAAIAGSVLGGWKALQLMRSRDVGAADLPPPSGGASTALDRVERPAPPGSPRPASPPTKD